MARVGIGNGDRLGVARVSATVAGSDGWLKLIMILIEAACSPRAANSVIASSNRVFQEKAVMSHHPVK